MQIKVNVDQLIGLGNSAERDAAAAKFRIKDGLETRVRAFVTEAQHNAPRRTGTLAESIDYTEASAPANSVAFTADIGADYGPYVVEGTAPHLITPRFAKALRFLGSTGVVFARVVHHPGTKPNAFWDAALADNSTQAQFDAIGQTLTQSVELK